MLSILSIRQVYYCFYTSSKDSCPPGATNISANDPNFVDQFQKDDYVYLYFADDIPLMKNPIFKSLYKFKYNYHLYLIGIDARRIINFEYSIKSICCQYISLINVELPSAKVAFKTNEIRCFNSSFISKLFEQYITTVTCDIYSLQSISTILFYTLTISCYTGVPNNMSTLTKIHSVFPKNSVSIIEINDDALIHIEGHFISLRFPRKNTSLVFHPLVESPKFNFQFYSPSVSISNRFISNTLHNCEINIKCNDTLNATFTPTFWDIDSPLTISFSEFNKLNITSYCDALPITIHDINEVAIYQMARQTTLRLLTLTNSTFNFKTRMRLDQQYNLQIQNAVLKETTFLCNEIQSHIFFNSLSIDTSLSNVAFRGSGKYHISGDITSNQQIFFENLVIEPYARINIMDSCISDVIVKSKKLELQGQNNYIVQNYGGHFYEPGRLCVLHSDNIVDVSKFNLLLPNIPKNYYYRIEFENNSKSALYILSSLNEKYINLCVINSQAESPNQCPIGSKHITIDEFEKFSSNSDTIDICFLTSKDVAVDASGLSNVKNLRIRSFTNSRIKINAEKLTNVEFTDLTVEFTPNLIANQIKFKNCEIIGLSKLNSEIAQFNSTTHNISTIVSYSLSIDDFRPAYLRFEENEIIIDEKLNVTVQQEFICTDFYGNNTIIEINGESISKFSLQTNPAANDNQITIKKSKSISSYGKFKYSGNIITDCTLIPINFKFGSVWFNVPNGITVEIPKIVITKKLTLSSGNVIIKTSKLVFEETATIGVVGNESKLIADEVNIDVVNWGKDIGKFFSLGTINISKSTILLNPSSIPIDNHVINVNFEMNSVPYLKVKDTQAENVTIVMSNFGSRDEIDMSTGWNGNQVEVICGEDLKCQNWKTSWNSDCWAFNSTDKLFDLKCVKSLITEGENCMAIVAATHDGDAHHQKTSNLSLVLYIVGGSIALAAISVIMFLFIYRKYRRGKIDKFLSDRLIGTI